jgi:hypothetical protein
LGFSEENARIFVSGSTGPDSHGDFPHAFGKDRKILDKLDEARTLFLLNDEYSYGEVANALHYIRDKWTRTKEGEKEDAVEICDEEFMQSIEHLGMPEEAKKVYLGVAESLLTVKNLGIESFFDHSWGIWHRDYMSCVYVFADVVEMMLPTLQPDASIRGNRERLEKYVRSEAFKKGTQEGFFASLVTNFLCPKLVGYPAAMYCLASLSPPVDFRGGVVDLEIAYRLSLEIARYTLLSSEQFRHQDAWTERAEREKEKPKLAFVLPEYHGLIPKPTDEVRQERLLIFDAEERRFLGEWPDVAEGLRASGHHSDRWRMLLFGLVELLKEKQGWA